MYYSEMMDPEFTADLGLASPLYGPNDCRARLDRKQCFEEE